MKLTILLLAFSLAVLSSCTTSYKTGQTPDDVYYSPVRPQEEYVQSENDKESPKRYEDEYYEDRYLRMKVRNRTRWSDLDDWYYSDYRNRYNVYMGCCFCNNSWTPYSHWNNYYNPYYQNYVIIKNVKAPVYNKPRTFNLNAYNQPTSNTRNLSNTKTNNGSSTPRNNATKNSGNRLRSVFDDTKTSSSSSNSSSSNTKPSNSSSSTTPSSTPSSSSSSSPAPVRRF